MKPFIFGCLLIVGFVAALFYPPIANALFEFIFLGIIPGTDMQISFWTMVIALVIGGFILIRWLTSQPLYIGGLARQEQTARQLARKKIKKRTNKTISKTRSSSRRRRSTKR